MQRTSAFTAKPFGQAIRKRRLAIGLTQEQLALDCDLHPVYISMLERGLRHPTLDKVFKLAERLGIHPSLLVKDVEKLLNQQES